MASDSGIFTTILNTFLNTLKGGYGLLLPDTMGLLGILALLEISVASVWWAFADDVDPLKELLMKIIKIGFFIFLVTQWQPLCSTVIKGFIDTGLKAGSGTEDFLNDPSKIVDLGLERTQPIFKWIQELGYLDTLKNYPQIILSGWCGLLIMVAFIVIAGLVILTYIEFYMVAVLCMILLPFGVFKHTAWIAEKVFAAVISFGVRLMTLAFVISVSRPILEKMSPPPDFGKVGFSITPMFALLGACVIILMLAWHAPAVAAGIMSGSPALSGGSAAGVGGAIGSAAGAAAGPVGGPIAKVGGAAARKVGGAAAKAGGAAVGKLKKALKRG